MVLGHTTEQGEKLNLVLVEHKPPQPDTIAGPVMTETLPEHVVETLLKEANDATSLAAEPSKNEATKWSKKNPTSSQANKSKNILEVSGQPNPFFFSEIAEAKHIKEVNEDDKEEIQDAIMFR